MDSHINHLPEACSDRGNNHIGEIKNIYSVDIETGEISIAAERNVGGDNVEVEGMTFWQSEDGSNMHVLDYNKVIGVFVHHYKVGF